MLEKDGFTDLMSNTRLVNMFSLYHDGTCMSENYASCSLWGVSKSETCKSLISGARPKATGYQHLDGLDAGHAASTMLLESHFNSTMKLEWPIFKSLMDRVMDLNGIAARKQTYDKEHPRQMDFRSRFDFLLKHEDAEGFALLVEEMVTYLGGAVVNEGGLAGFVPYYVHGEQTYDHLMEELFAAATSDNGWVRFGGDYAHLSEVGYTALMHYDQPDEFLRFVDRAIRGLDMHVADPEALESFTAFFNGVCAEQNFAMLEQELLQAERLPAECGGGWLQPNPITARA